MGTRTQTGAVDLTRMFHVKHPLQSDCFRKRVGGEKRIQHQQVCGLVRCSENHFTLVCLIAVNFTCVWSIAVMSTEEID